MPLRPEEEAEAKYTFVIFPQLILNILFCSATFDANYIRGVKKKIGPI